jgi:hypothetical protein
MNYQQLLKHIFFSFLFLNLAANAQTAELETAQTKITKIWGGIAANGDRATFDFRAGFFPNDYDIIQYRGQGSENYLGSGFTMGCINWLSPTDSLYTAAVFGPTNDFMINGKVLDPIKSYIRYKYPTQTINTNPVTIENFAVHDPSQFSDGTFDQITTSTYKNVLGVDVKRTILGWSQNYNDNYVIIEVELTNTGVDKKTPEGRDTLAQDTLRNFYFAMNQGFANNYSSNGLYPALSGSERPKYNYVWQHYYGAREVDSLRVFYAYSADAPENVGDDMGSPVISQNGRLVNTNINFYTILHASQQPFINSASDIDDLLQPKVTYIGTETRIPNPGQGEDPYGSKNFWAMRGGFSDKNLMPSSIPGTHHMINNDELGIANFSQFPGGTLTSTNSKNFSSFGPYEFPPNHKIRIVYAVGITGIGLEESREIGMAWQNGTITNPSNMPDPNTGWLPSTFVFPVDATEKDKTKDRWISMGLDSVMLSAWRAKWNFQNNYQIPQAPPPPEEFHVKGSGIENGVIINWKGTSAENFLNFAGYRIMRKFSNQDTVYYQQVYSSGSEDKANEHTFIDNDVLSGGSYYYYIQTKAVIDEDDLNADPTTRGKILYSSRLWIPNILSVKPPKLASEDMSMIRIVPNPYNINDPLVRSLYASKDGRQINFYNLPPVVTIRIYTENGDLVKTIEHSSPVEQDGSEFWDMLTDNQQVISSGVYIASFQKPDGEKSFQKFIVIR